MGAEPTDVAEVLSFSISPAHARTLEAVVGSVSVSPPLTRCGPLSYPSL